MKQQLKLSIAGSLVPILLLSANLACADEFVGNVSGYLGTKSVNSSDWKAKDADKNSWGDYSDQGAIGVISDFKMKSWPVSIAVDVFASAAESKVNGDELYGGTYAAHLGLRKVWNRGNSSVHPYLGGGLAIMGGKREQLVNGIKEDDDDSTIGGWVGTGVYWRPHQSINIGLDLRYSSGEVEIFNDTVEVGGTQFGILVGYHW